MKVKKLREVGSILGREGLSELVIEMVQQFDGSYKGAMELTGKLSTVAKMAGFDDYWLEQVNKGVTKAEFIAEQKLENSKSSTLN